MKWWWKPDRDYTQTLNWIRQNISDQIGHYDNIALYIWIGTCDLTRKNKQYSSLANHDNSSLDNIKENFKEILQSYGDTSIISYLYPNISGNPCLFNI